jgi:flagellar protein FliS
MNTAFAYAKPGARRAINQYNQNSILNASPVELILKIYDLTIVSIRKRDIKKARLAITELIAALNFEYQEQAMGLFRLYRYCQDCLNQEKYDEALQIFEDLRNTWAEAFNLE